MAKIISTVILCFCFIFLVDHTIGHGFVENPISRSSRWRIDPSAPHNYEDNQLFCGGFAVQYSQNGGKCGMCGDNYADPTPRPNELGGTFGQGVIVASYPSGGVMPVTVDLTANHKGFFIFKLCNLDQATESDNCFNADPLRLTNGRYQYFVPNNKPGLFNMTVQLPAGLSCSHCVLQWTYHTGNSWGVCPDGSGALGCGNQETFRTCSDIRIG